MGSAALVVALAGCAPEPRGRPAPRAPAPTSPPPAPTSSAPTPPAPTTPRAPPALEVEGRPATSLGTSGLSTNARIQPHGRPTRWWVEHGPTTALGRRGEVHTLGPTLTAHYLETWDGGTAAWAGGSGQDLVHVPSGGPSGGYVRYAEPTATDYNHADGIGLLHLAQYAYPGDLVLYVPSLALGGGDPDLSDARIEVALRGESWTDYEFWLDPTLTPFDRGEELVWWSQVDATGDLRQLSNWAHTGSPLSAALYSGAWETVSYRLTADTNLWSYAGSDRAQGRDVYVYHPLREVLRHCDVDVFHLLLGIDPYIALGSAISFDSLHVTYRNHSLLSPTNGGTLTASPPGAAEDPDRLTDGWRAGADHAWRSDDGPAEPLTFRWSLAHEAVVERVLVHNHPEWPANEVAVSVSSDGATWTPVWSGPVPADSPYGPNFAYAWATGLAVPAREVEVTIRSGARPEAWGLAEVELYGVGAVQATDDDWYGVTEDLGGLSPGETVHWRIVAEQDGARVAGPTAGYAVPDGAVPEVTTGASVRYPGRRLRLDGVVNTLGGRGTWSIELGPDDAYGFRTTPQYTGPELTPRTFARVIDFDHPTLAGLDPASPLHWRMSFCGACDDVDPANDAWVHGADATAAVP